MQTKKENEMGRGATQAVKDAILYLQLHPDTSAKFLAVKFGIDTSTVYRSDWWQANKKAREAQQQGESK